MTQTTEIASAAKGLARNPLGISALFIVLVYGLAALVTAASGLAREERLPLIYFLVVFPFVVLGVFAWLVSSHAVKLFSPADFKDERHYLEMQFSAGTWLAAASAKGGDGTAERNISKVLQVVKEAAPHDVSRSDGWRKHVLWVDDRPENNVYERRAFEAVGLSFSLALSTNEALKLLEQQQFAAVISDMSRKEGTREGYVLLDTMRASGNETPLFFYAASNEPKHKKETADHGGQGCTNSAQELFQIVMKGVISNVG